MKRLCKFSAPQEFAPRIGPIALLALLYTVWVLFALQGHEVIKHIAVCAALPCRCSCELYSRPS